jgi:hypothetical protein
MIIAQKSGEGQINIDLHSRETILTMSYLNNHEVNQWHCYKHCTERKTKMLDGEIELFLDKYRVSSEYNIVKRLCQPEKHSANPILHSEHPWEELYVTMYGNVLPKEDGSGYRMWYTAGAKRMQKCQYLCYAESEDGFHFQRIMTDRFPYGNSLHTNIVCSLEHNIHGPHIVRNRHNDDSQQRYLMFFDSYPQSRPDMAEQLQGGRWCYTMTSPDGLIWNPPQGRLAVPGKSDVGNSVVWDSKHKRYIVYMRGTRPHEAFKPFDQPWGEGMRVRYVRAAVSDDFEHWSEPVELLRADQEEGDPYNHIHQFTVTRRGGQFIALRSMFRVEELNWVEYENQGKILMEDGVCDSQLAVSRDGLAWSCVADRAKFLSCGGPGQWDHRWMVTPGEFVVEDKRMLFYYGASHLPRSKPPMHLAIGVAVLPRDRFQAMRPRLLHQPGVLETKPLYLSPGDLKINADASQGKIVAELCDFNGVVIDGFSRELCNPVASDGLDLTIRWKERKLSDAIDQQNLFRRAVRIRFYLHHATLYAAYLPLAKSQGI